MTSFDVVIVGAGVAGSAAAIELRAAGWQVGLLHFPREGARVESLSPQAVHDLTRLSVDVGASISEVVAWWGSEDVKRRAYPDARVVERTTLADRLRLRAAQQGATVWETEAHLHTERDGDGWRFELRASEPGLRFNSRYLVDATGRAAVVARRLGARRQTVNELYSLSVQTIEPKFVGTWTESRPDGWWNLCCGHELGTLSFYSTASVIRERKQDVVPHLAETQHLRSLLATQRFVKGSTNACGSSRLVPCAGPDWVSAGDAAWTVEPLASAGISKALRDAQLVARGLENGANHYDRFQEKEFNTYLRRLTQQYRLERRWSTSPFWKIRQEDQCAMDIPAELHLSKAAAMKELH